MIPSKTEQYKYTIYRRLQIVLVIAFLTLMIGWPILTYAATLTEDGFLLDIRVNGQDLSEQGTILTDPEGDLTINIRVFEVTKEVTLERVYAEIIFAGLKVATLNRNLGSVRVTPGNEYRETITINAEEVLKRDSLLMITGIYTAEVNLEYTVAGQVKTWDKSQDIKIPGNPISTPAGMAAVAITGATAAAGLLF